MKTFDCDHCGQPLFFENVQCLRCDSSLAFLPDGLTLAAIEPMPQDEGLWRRRARQDGVAGGRAYRLCRNHTEHQACNFAVPADDPNPLCASCRLTRILPDLSVPQNRSRWYRIEVAKRRLFYTLAKLGLVAAEPPGGGRDGPVFEFLADLPGQRVLTGHCEGVITLNVAEADDAERDGPMFEFLADLPGQQVLTGHCEGVITLNVAEADDAERVRRRIALHEPYRTLLGHLRHESGHYYWDRLILEGGRADEFRATFGDERADYAQALASYYAAGGAPADWQDHHVSAYATSHPWEDWAETWAHYLHMVDLLETASSYSTKVALPGRAAQDVEEVINPFASGPADFNRLVEQWVPLTLLLNSLNRSLGQDDAYPFALSGPALEKLRFVHDLIQARPAREPAPGSCQAQAAAQHPSPAA